MADKVPLGIRVLPQCFCVDRNISYRIFILIFTFLCYTSYHLSRKPISVVKSVLHQKNCSIPLDPDDPVRPELSNSTACDWAPFDGGDSAELLGSLDLAYLFAYAVGMFMSGHLAERMNLRYFLSIGMISSGVLTAAFGMGYFFNIHVLWFYVLVQVLAGVVQSSGWPSVVTCVGNWYGKGRRGFIMGVWNSHTSVGNILGSFIAGVWVNHIWGWSFVVPGMIIAGLGVLVFFFLVPNPTDVNCELPQQHDPEPKTVNSTEQNNSHMRSPNNYRESTDYASASSMTPLLSGKEEKAISLFAALKIPGVIEFSLCLFFAKLVSYTFLFWLPKYIFAEAKYTLDPEFAADLSTLFDVGGMAGGIAAGLFSDFTGARASTCAVMLVLAAPLMYIYNLYGSLSKGLTIGLLIVCGFMVNGPYALITTAVSADLGTHKSLKGNSKALATVTAIIDGTGSIGAAVGPLLTGILSPHGWNSVFYMLIAADGCAFLLLIRLIIKEVQKSRFFSSSEVTIVAVEKQ